MYFNVICYSAARSSNRSSSKMEQQYSNWSVTLQTIVQRRLWATMMIIIIIIRWWDCCNKTVSRYRCCVFTDERDWRTTVSVPHVCLACLYLCRLWSAYSVGRLNSLVIKVIRPRAWRPRNQGLLPGRVKICLSSRRAQTGCGSHKHTCRVVNGV